MDKRQIQGNELTKVEKYSLLCIGVLLFQTARNINLILYMLVLFSSYALLYINFLFNKNGIKVKYNFAKVLFFFTLLSIPIVSLAHIPINEFLIAMPRYLVTLPMIFFLALYKDYRIRYVNSVLKLFVIFILLASLSIPYQIIFGPIPFLAEMSYRGGLERYASLAGSLTALGTLGAYALVISFFLGDKLFNKRINFVISALIIMGMLLTLQKAAILNIILVLNILFFWRLSIKKIAKIILVAIFIYGSYSVLLKYFNDFFIVQYIDTLVNYSFSQNDVGTTNDLLKRLWYYTENMITINNVTTLGLIIGIGFKALSGTMGLPHHPMLHNNYFDLLLSGGILHLVSFLLISARIPMRVFYKIITNRQYSTYEFTYSAIIILIFANMLIGGSSFYQPAIGIVTFFIIFSYDYVNISHKSIYKLRKAERIYIND